MSLSMFSYNGHHLVDGVPMDVMIDFFKRAAVQDPSGTLDDLNVGAVVSWSLSAGPGKIEIKSADGGIRVVEVPVKGAVKKRSPLVELRVGDLVHLLPSLSGDEDLRSSFTLRVAGKGNVVFDQGVHDFLTSEIDPVSTDTDEMAAARLWLQSNDTGVSSLTISHVLLGIPQKMDRLNGPLDPSDFGRCVRLLEKVPSLRSRMSELASTPGWKNIAPRWDEFESLYREGMQKGGNCEELYERLGDAHRPSGTSSSKHKRT